MVNWRRALAGLVIGIVILIAVLRLVPAIGVLWPGEDASSFLTAVAALFSALQWPLVIALIAFLFRAEFRKIIPRITGGEFLGGKLTIGAEVAESAAASELIERLNAIEQRFDQSEARLTAVEDRQALEPGERPISADTVQTLPKTPRHIPEDWYQANSLRIRKALRLVAEGQWMDRSDLDPADPVTAAQESVLKAAISSPTNALILLTDTIRDELYGMARDLGLDTTDRRPAHVAQALASDGYIDQLTVDALNKYWKARSAAIQPGR